MRVLSKYFIHGLLVCVMCIGMISLYSTESLSIITPPNCSNSMCQTFPVYTDYDMEYEWNSKLNQWIWVHDAECTYDSYYQNGWECYCYWDCTVQITLDHEPE